MKKYIFLFIASLMLFSCAEEEVFNDQTTYAEFDNNYIFQDSEKFSDEVLDKELSKLGEADLTPGYHTVTMNLDPSFVAEGITTERLFTYFVPDNLQDNFDIVFELHGNFNYNPTLDRMSVEPWMLDLYRTKNAILVIPLGSIGVEPTSESVYGWYVDKGDLNFIDLMIRYFGEKVKDASGFELNPSGIFSTGQSSGAIFSWQLAYYRSEVMTAVVPRFGSVRLQPEMTIGADKKYKVPMRVILGEIDPIVDYDAAMNNADNWAKYFMGIESGPGSETPFAYCIYYNKKDPTRSSYSIGYSQIWQNENAYLETYSLPKMGHGHTALIADYERFVYEFFMDHRRQ